jgi:hypothetical protein
MLISINGEYFNMMNSRREVVDAVTYFEDSRMYPGL